MRRLKRQLQIKLVIAFLSVAFIPVGVVVFLSPVRATGPALGGAALLGGAIALIVAFVVSRRLVEPITHLTTVAHQIAGGDLAVEALVDSQDELGRLADAFNRMTAQTRQALGSMENQLEERTRDLILSMEVGQRAAAFKELDALLLTITEFIRTQFELYYVHVYLIDDGGQNLIMRAGTGSVGKLLLARRHTLPVGPGSMVGQAAAGKKSVVVPDTSRSNIHRPNPLLPETRSELAVPLIVEAEVIGVLDMQSDRVDTFTDRNATVFEAMATQLAISIEGARQWALAQDAQQRLEQTVRRLTHEAWVEHLGQQTGDLSFVYDLAAVKPAGPDSLANGDASAPLMVQNEPIGRLAVRTPAGKILSADEQELLAAVAQQLAQKAENMRLFEATQRQAAREQLARQITDRIRTSRDIESALRTAAEELSKALGAANATIELQVTPQSRSEENGVKT